MVILNKLVVVVVVEYWHFIYWHKFCFFLEQKRHYMIMNICGNIWLCRIKIIDIMKITLCTNRASKYGEPLTRPGHLSQKATNWTQSIHSHFNNSSLSTVAILTCILSAKIVASQGPFKERMMYKLSMM